MKLRFDCALSSFPCLLCWVLSSSCICFMNDCFSLCRLCSSLPSPSRSQLVSHPCTLVILFPSHIRQMAFNLDCEGYYSQSFEFYICCRGCLRSFRSVALQAPLDCLCPGWKLTLPYVLEFILVGTDASETSSSFQFITTCSSFFGFIVLRHLWLYPIRESVPCVVSLFCLFLVQSLVVLMVPAMSKLPRVLVHLFGLVRPTLWALAFRVMPEWWYLWFEHGCL